MKNMSLEMSRVGLLSNETCSIYIFIYSELVGVLKKKIVLRRK